MKLILTLLSALIYNVNCVYEPTWDSLNTRPLPAWYEEAKFGIFIHWGIYSVPAIGTEWFWMNWEGRKSQGYVKFMEKNYKPGFSYPEFGPMFTAEFYNPDSWADLIEASGAKYTVITTKHHEGYTLWPSNYSVNWNSKAVGPHRDLIGDLEKSIKTRTNVTFGLYYSLYEWFHPLYISDRESDWKTRKYVETKAWPELMDLVNIYKPSVIWTDGDWEPIDTYWNSTGYIAWLYNESPVKDTIVTNDRWGSGVLCKVGDIYTCADRYNPGVLQEHKWENAMTIDRYSWGYRRSARLEDYMNIEDLIRELVETVSCNGNLLMNIGPTHDGRIIPLYEERLRQMGNWLKVNGEAIYASKPWSHQNDTLTSGVWYTSKGSTVYATVLNWPEDNTLTLGAVDPPKNLKVSMLGYDKPIEWKESKDGIEITFPYIAPNKLPSPYAWVLKFDSLPRTKKSDM